MEREWCIRKRGKEGIREERHADIWDEKERETCRHMQTDGMKERDMQIDGMKERDMQTDGMKKRNMQTDRMKE